MKKNQPRRLLAAAALLACMHGTARGRADTIFVALPSDGSIEQFDTFANGSVFAFASLAFPQGVAFDGSGNLYVANNSGGVNGNGSIEKFTPGGVASVFAADPGDGSVLSGPEGLAFDSTGNLYVANDGGWIEKFDTSGAPTLFVSDPGDGSVFNNPYGLAFDKTGNLYVANFSGGANEFGSIEKITPGGAASLFASDPGTGTVLNGPEGLAFDRSGELYVANTTGGAAGFGSIEKFTAGGSASLFAADPGDGSILNNPGGLAFDKTGNLYVANSFGGVNGYGSIEKFATNGSVSSFIFDPGDGSFLNNPQGLAFDSAGSLSVANSSFNANIGRFDMNGLKTDVFLSSLSNPQSMAIDNSGNLYVANYDEGTIEKFDPDGVGAFFATNASTLGLALDGGGHLYAAGSLQSTIEKFDINGVGSRFASAGVVGPEGLAFDRAGNLYAVNLGNNTIEKFNTNGVDTLFASAGANGPFGPSLAFDAAGNLYAELKNSIRKFATNGTSSLFASDPGDGSVLSNPQGMDFDSAGNLYVANPENGTIEKFDTNGDGSVFVSGLDSPSGLVVQRAPFLIDNLNVTPRPGSAIISWTTPGQATGQVLYGTTPAYGSFSALNKKLQASQAVLLTGLKSNTVYYFQAVSTQAQNVAIASSSFSTDVSVIVQAPQATYNGVWTLATSAPDKYSSIYKYASTTMGSGTASASFAPDIVTPGYYDVYIWYSEGSNRSANVPVVISFPGGYVLTNINQTLHGGSWQLLTSSQYFAAGPSGLVRIGNSTDETNKVVIADAVQWVYSAGQDSATNGIIPSWWANFYFGTNSVNSATPGSNGLSLLADYVIGLTPTNPGALLDFNIVSIPHGFQAAFSPWQDGRIYGLQSTTTLLHPTWIAVPNLIANKNSNGQGVIVYTNAHAARTFYRLSVELSP